MWEHYQATGTQCTVCGSGFEVQFRYQVRQESDSVVFFCSQQCMQNALQNPAGVACDACHQSFTL